MSRLRVIMVLLFVVAFGAGLSLGKVLHRPVHVTPRPQPDVVQPPRNDPPREQGGTSWLSTELGLSDVQREEMLAIWNTVYQAGSPERNERREIQKQRTEAINNLIPEDRKQDLVKVNEEYERKMNEILERGKKRYTQAVEKTKALLTPQQREKYDEILSRRDDQRRRRGPGAGPGNDRGPRDGAEQRPAGQSNPQNPAPAPTPAPAPAGSN